MSIPEKKIKEIRNGYYASIEEEIKTNSKKVVEKKRELEEIKQRYTLLRKSGLKLSDIRYIYDKATTLQKREFVNKVFDGNLYYQEGIYRTTTMLDLLSHNANKMEEKGYLIYNKKRDNLSTIPQSGR